MDFRYVTIVANEFRAADLVAIPQTQLSIVAAAENSSIVEESAGSDPVVVAAVTTEKLMDLLASLYVVQT